MRFAKGRLWFLPPHAIPPWGMSRQSQGLCVIRTGHSVSILIVQWQPVVMGWLALVKLLGFFSLNVESHQSCQKSQLASMTSYSCHRQPTWRFYLKQSCYGTFCIKLVTFQGNVVDPREESRNGVCAM